LVHQNPERPTLTHVNSNGIRSFGKSTGTYTIEVLQPHHLGAVGDLFCENFPDNLMVKLGPGAVFEFLNSYICIPGGCGYVSLCRGQVIGFVLGSENAPAFRRAWLRRRWRPLGLQVVRGLAGTPSIAWRLLRNIRPYLQPARLRPPRSVHPVEAEPIPLASLILLAVSSDHRRRGVADQLTGAFLRAMAQRGVDRVKLIVAATNRAALAFYQSQGWQIAERYSVPDGGNVYQLTYDLSAADTMRETRSA
jgi:ribosomal protein S18 acetylase RimI-like enzyme